jgi:alkylation response protein AidB-like acyl-CoA dehydrogenase
MSIDFQLTEEQELLRATIRSFLNRELAPVVDDYEQRERYPIELLPKLGELGVLGLGLSEELGGAGGHVEVAILTEELAAVAGGFCSGTMTHSIGAKVIAEFGSPTQIERYIPSALAGELMTAIAITEPAHGSDVAGLETTARHSDSGWVLRGQKMFITNASHAGVFMVMATTDRSQGRDGISMFLVDRDAPGLEVGPPLSKLGWHTSDTCPVHFDDCEIPADALLGVQGEGFTQLMQGFVFERVIMAAMGVGAARAALEDAVQYAREREQFGRPIAEFQAIRHQLAQMATELEAARLLTYKAAWDADRDPTASASAAMAKLFATETASRIAERAVQVFGGAGFMNEVRVSRIYRDVKVLTIGGGTSEIMRSIIAKSLEL